MTKTRLYLLLLLACGSGYFWIIYLNFINPSLFAVEGTVCMFKHVTGIPCPSCGSTRSLLSLLHGNFAESFFWNPFGLLLAGLLVLIPVWLLFDLMLKKDSLFKFYRHTEKALQKRWVAAPAILLVLVNWIWNIHKGL